MTMRVYVPSRARSSVAISGTARYFFSEALAHLVTYVVPYGEGRGYRECLPHYRVVETPQDVANIAQTRLFIGRLARDLDQSTFLMLDDDLKLLTRADAEGVKLRGQSTHDTAQMLYYVREALSDHAHVGVSTREGNNRVGPGGWLLRAECTRTLRALAYRTEDFLRCEHGRVPVMEDFDVNLQLLRRGLSNANLFFWSQDQAQTQAPGGCSVYRTKESHEAAARRLAELHPGLVKLRQKENKTGGEFGSRTEVTIFWKKAYESARERNER